MEVYATDASPPGAGARPQRGEVRTDRPARWQNRKNERSIANCLRNVEDGNPAVQRVPTIPESSPMSGSAGAPRPGPTATR